MVKKIRFPLVMENEVEVRSLDELRENFSLAQVIFYFENGKLVTWLRDRYEDDLADKVSALDKTDADFEKKLCECFDVPFDEKSMESLEEAKERQHKLGLLKQAGVDEKFNAYIDRMAFEQDDIFDLLDNGNCTIYLCGKEFSIPLGKKGIHYIGVNRPMVKIAAKTVVDFAAKDIQLENVQYDPAYQKLLVDTAKEAAEKKKPVPNNAHVKYSIEDRRVDFGMGVPLGCRALVKTDLKSGEETIIYANLDFQVYDFVDFGDNIVLLVGDSSALSEGKFSVVGYSKASGNSEMLPVKLRSVDRPPEGYTLHMIKIGLSDGCIIEPEERTVVFTRTKIVYKDAWGIQMTDYQGTPAKQLSLERAKTSLIASCDDDFYYTDGKSVYRYNTVSNYSEKVAEYGYKILYDAKAIYCVPSAPVDYVWAMTKISMKDKKVIAVFLPQQNGNSADDIELKDGKISIQGGVSTQSIGGATDSMDDVFNATMDALKHIVNPKKY